MTINLCRCRLGVDLSSAWKLSVNFFLLNEQISHWENSFLQVDMEFQKSKNFKTSEGDFCWFSVFRTHRKLLISAKYLSLTIESMRPSSRLFKRFLWRVGNFIYSLHCSVDHKLMKNREKYYMITIFQFNFVISQMTLCLQRSQGESIIVGNVWGLLIFFYLIKT